MDSVGVAASWDSETLKTCIEKEGSCELLKTCIEKEESPSVLPVVTLISESSKVETSGDDAKMDASSRKNLRIRCSLRTNESGSIEGVQVKNSVEHGGADILVFSLKQVDFIFVPESNQKSQKVMIKLLGKSRNPNTEWRFLAQMRICALREQEKKLKWSVDDCDVFEFGNRVPPLFIHVSDLSVAEMRFVFCFVHKMHDELPRFDSGDVRIRFSDEEDKDARLVTYKSLLRMHSTVLDLLLDRAPEVEGRTELALHGCALNSFRELLYQLYPTQRPVYADFRGLCSMAVTFRVQLVLDKLSSHLVSYEHLTFEEKIEHAVKLGLDDAISELVYNAVKSGQWAHMINRGFDPKEMFPHVYFEVICPSVAKALVDPTPYAYLRESHWVDFEHASLANNPSYVHLKVSGTTFYVNQAILMLHNASKFGRGSNGEYYVNMTLGLRNEMEKCQLRMVDLIRPLLLHLYGRQKILHVDLVRPLIIFAVVHQMPYLKESLEEMLLLEPPITAHTMLDHLKLAEMYELKNLKRATLFRMEGSYKGTAAQLVGSEQYKNTLSPSFQQEIRTALNCNWAKANWDRLNKSRPNKQRERRIPMKADPMDEDLATLRQIDAADVFPVQRDLF